MDRTRTGFPNTLWLVVCSIGILLFLSKPVAVLSFVFLLVSTAVYWKIKFGMFLPRASKMKAGGE
jgi:hypothetical protein